MKFTNKINTLRQEVSGYRFIPFKNALQPYLILFFVSVSLYLNTFNHEVAFDDESVLHKNEFVMMGVRGIPGILTHDSYYSYYKQLGFENNLPGGRYRPLSQVTFAIEQEFIGTLPDGIVRENSWDVNLNGVKDQFEDTNEDGIYNEYDFWSKGSGMRHVINVALYGLLALIIYHVLINNFFTNRKDMVFFAVLLFAVHPLHTEVVANIKSRDEILSLLLIFMTIHYTFKFLNFQGKRNLFFVILFMFLSLLSKEYAVLLFGLVPSLLYVYYQDKINLGDKKFWLMAISVILSAVSLIWFFNQGTLIAVPFLFAFAGYFIARSANQSIIKLIYGLGIGLVLYLALRFSATTHDVQISSFETDIIANPYKFATEGQKWASKIAIWIKYIVLFFVPQPLLVDYSYKTIPYSDFSSVKVWISIIFYSATILLTVISFIKRSKWFLPLVLFIGFFIPVANVFIDIGATMGERLFFHASIGFVLLISMSFFVMIEKINDLKLRLTFLAILTLPLFAFSFLSVKRNPDWKNNNTLFLHDVQFAPDNINVLSGAGVACYELSAIEKDISEKKKWIIKANQYYDHSLSIIPDQYPVYYNKSVNFLSIGELDSALVHILNVERIAPGVPNLRILKSRISNRLMLKGVAMFQKGDTLEGIKILKKSVMADSTNVKALNNLGKAYFDTKSYDYALVNFKKTVKLQPENKMALDAISKIRSVKGEKKESLESILAQLKNDKKNPDLWCKMGYALMETGAYDKAYACFQSAVKLDSQNKEASSAIQQLNEIRRNLNGNK